MKNKPTQAQQDLVDGMIDLGNGLFLEEAAYCTYLWKKPSKHSHYFRVTQQDLADHVAEEVAKGAGWQTDLKKMPKGRCILFVQKGSNYVFEGIHLVGLMDNDQAKQNLTGHTVDVIAWMEKPTPPTEQKG